MVNKMQADSMCGAFVVDTVPSSSGKCITLVPDDNMHETHVESGHDVYRCVRLRPIQSNS